MANVILDSQKTKHTINQVRIYLNQIYKTHFLVIINNKEDNSMQKN